MYGIFPNEYKTNLIILKLPIMGFEVFHSKYLVLQNPFLKMVSKPSHTPAASSYDSCTACRGIVGVARATSATTSGSTFEHPADSS
jgi:hypothetical protein